MIKKRTKMMFLDSGEIVEDQGGIPLSVGEVMKLKRGQETQEYTVIGKTIECMVEGEWEVEITYSLSKK